MNNIIISNNFYVYRHRRLDTNEIFYVGIGTKYRPKSKSGRNNYWNNIVNKTEYRVEILFHNISKQKAIDLEIALIRHYGRKDLKKGSLVNRTNGGDGNFGLITSEETKEKQRIAKIGKKQNIEIVKKRNLNNSRGKCYKSKKIINIVTNIIYDCIQDAAEANNINYKTLKYYLSNNLNKKNKFKIL